MLVGFVVHSRPAASVLTLYLLCSACRQSFWMPVVHEDNQCGWSDTALSSVMSLSPVLALQQFRKVSSPTAGGGAATAEASQG